MGVFSIARKVYRGLTRSQRKQVFGVSQAKMGDRVLRDDTYHWDQHRASEDDIANLTAKLGEVVGHIAPVESIAEVAETIADAIPSADTILHMSKGALVELAELHALEVLGTGAKGAVKKSDLVDALIAAQ